jgi:hypothetical protein
VRLVDEARLRALIDHERMDGMSEIVKVKVLLLVGDEAEVVADVPDPDAPVRYSAGEIAGAVGRPVGELPGTRLVAEADERGRLSGWRLA